MLTDFSHDRVNVARERRLARCENVIGNPYGMNQIISRAVSNSASVSRFVLIRRKQDMRMTTCEARD